MKIEERDEMIQYFIRIREKVKSDEGSILPLLKELAAKISGLEEERKQEKIDLLDFIDNYKTLIINMPVEERRIEKAKRWWQR